MGTAIGVATIVALLAIADGIKTTAGQLVHLGRADLGLFQANASDPTTSVLPTSLVPRLAHQRGVADATPILLLAEAMSGQPSALVFGARPDGFLTKRLVMVAGRAGISETQVVVGDSLARQAHLRPGRPVTISGHRFTVSGIYHAGIPFEDSGAVMAIATAQKLAGRQGEATTIAIQLAPGVHANAAEQAITRAFPGLVAFDEPGEAVRAGANGRLITQAATVIVVLALLIGGIAVMTTQLLATLERRGEFAVMSAVGWSSTQVASLVLAESAATGVLGAMFGLVLGVVGSDLLITALGAGEFVNPQITSSVLARGLLVGGLIGLLGGLYPAWRVARLRPAPILAGR